MCGLAAIFSNGAQMGSALHAALVRMQARGPDGEGTWFSEGVALGHRRLAVIDLDTRAAQPMHSTCGRYVIVFNGEIYNLHLLRRELKARGEAFRTSSDTEVILSLFAREGEAMLPKLHGMFAFVIWDRSARRAFAARDPYGIKPLYFAKLREGVAFASQVKALLATGLVSREPDLHGQAGFWMLGSVPEPHTWYRNVEALPAGHYAWVENERITASRCWQDIGQFWHAEADPDDRDMPARVGDALRECVARHLVADVPIGVFLSGGIDSGALAGLMAERGESDLIGVTLAYEEFAGTRDDEAPAAAQIAAHYGIRHHVRRVTREEFQFDLPRILDAMDQPSIDGINTWYASKAVAELGLKVVVSGVGGDELFQGYGSFVQLPKIVGCWSVFARLPGAETLGRFVGHVQSRRSGNARWCHATDWLRTIEGAWWLRRSLHAPEELSSLMGSDEASVALSDFDVVEWVRRMTGPLPNNPRLALGQIESMTYLRNQLLRDSDWASMDHGVELRTPLVDAYLLRQLQSALPLFARHPGKILLAHAPEKGLPKESIRRGKTGFGIPLGLWSATGVNPGKRYQTEWMLRLAEFCAGDVV